MTRVARNAIFGDTKHFHILTDGLPALEVFEKPNMKNFYLATIEEKAKETNVSILAYCVMQNYSHLVVTSQDTKNISEFMRRVNTTYAKFFNRIKGRSGYVFNGRYESDPLKDNDMILSAINFVHNRPVKAKLSVTSSEYLYSSAKDYLNQLSFIDYKELKRLFKKIPELTSFGNSNYKFKEAKPYEDCDEVLIDLIRRFSITDKKDLQDPELLKTCIYELQTRSGVSLRDVAILLGIDREKVRRTALKINYNI